MSNLKETIQQLAQQYHPDVVTVRRHLHANPELSFEEYNTSKYVQEKLAEYGISYQAGIANTGIIGLIEGRKGSCTACRYGRTAYFRTKRSAL